MIGISVGSFWYELGISDFLYAWFSTINYHLEGKKWGSKFPIVMNEFYQGKVKAKNINILQQEIIEIQKQLKKYGPNEIIWNIENLSLQPQWGNNISSDITYLSNYFVTSNGEDLFDVVLSSIDMAIERKCELVIRSL
jgi:2,3-bisphosphoglycerate-dependent phosphoglycerate mutase